MLAVGLSKTSRNVIGFDLPTPSIKKDNEVLVRITQAGIDGTDRAIISHFERDLPAGSKKIVLGHEAIGVVEKVGKAVSGFKKGDLVAPTVRRGCGECVSCLNGESDSCFTGRYKERGIHGLDGYFTKYVVDEAQYLVKVPKPLGHVAVLVEPLSIAERAMEQINHIQSRLKWGCVHFRHGYDKEHWGACKRAVVFGAGAIGFSIAALLRLADVETHVVEIVGRDSLKGRLIESIGAKYIDGRKEAGRVIAEKYGPFHIMADASGSSELALNMIPFMSRNSISVLVGVPRGEHLVHMDSTLLLRQIVRYNQVVVGVLNSNRTHFEKALEDMGHIQMRFGSVLEKMITSKYPLSDYGKAFADKDPEQLKIILEP